MNCLLCNKPRRYIQFLNQNGQYCEITNHTKCRKLFEQREALDHRISILQNNLIELDFKINEHISKMK
jgi:hypothetical protein